MYKWNSVIIYSVRKCDDIYNISRWNFNSLYAGTNLLKQKQHTLCKPHLKHIKITCISNAFQNYEIWNIWVSQNIKHVSQWQQQTVSIIKVACTCISLSSLNIKENEANTKSTVTESTILSNSEIHNYYFLLHFFLLMYFFQACMTKFNISLKCNTWSIILLQIKDHFGPNLNSVLLW